MRSFTLVELLVIVGILIILTAIAVPAFRLFEKESALNNSAKEIINILRTAQNKTLASEEASQWGVYFATTTDPHQYVLFKGSDYDSRAALSDEIHKLPKSVKIYEIDLAGGNEVVFARITGTTDQSGKVSLALRNDPTKTRTVYIENSGLAGLTIPSVPSDENRIKDSRHIHFDLGWSIQDATTLKFKFLSPEPDQLETLDMANYFNASKTNFDWNNENSPFVVAGNDQVFRVHTHSLDGFNTLLCIHRDRNNEKNREEVIIYIVDGGIEKDIIHYLADAEDGAEKGFYVYNSMERQ